jgi:cysteine desulfurase
MTDPIYLDNLATTQLSREAAEVMREWNEGRFGNASSTTHPYGWAAADTVDEARIFAADLVGARLPNEMTFTSGATESNNTVIAGIIDSFPQPVHIVTSAIEHASILAPCAAFESRGQVTVTYVRPDEDGVVDPTKVAAAVTPATRLITIMAVNNEVGTVQRTRDIAAIARQAGVLVHVDAAQAVGKVDFNVTELGIDFASLSAHKIHGPQGIGALYCRAGAVPGGLPPLLRGGGQEQGRRAGTSPVALIAGFGAACATANGRWRADATTIRTMRDKLWNGIAADVTGLTLNGSETARIPGCLNFSIAGVLAESLIAATPNIAVSVGSACSGKKASGSHVLSAMNIDADRQSSTIRVGLSRYTTDRDVEVAVKSIVDSVMRLRASTAAA